MADLDQLIAEQAVEEDSGADEQLSELDQLISEQADAEVDPNVGELATGFAGGVNTGLVGMAGAPIDITNFLLDKIGLGTDEPVGGSEWIKNLVDTGKDVTGDMFPEPADTPLARGIHRVGEEVGANLIPSAALFRFAKGVAPTVSHVNRGLIQGKILDPIRRAPGSAATGELIATAGAGAGAGVAQEYFPDDAGAETTGQIVGGVTPALAGFTPTSLAVKTARLFKSRFSSKAQVDRAKTAINTMLGEELTLGAKLKMKEAERLAEKMPGFQPSIASSTESPALIAQQVKLESNMKGEVLNKLIRQRTDNEVAVDGYIKSTTPKSKEGMEYVVDTAKDKIDDVGDSITQLAGKNLQKQEDLANNIPTIDRVSSGAKIREALAEARRDVGTAMTARAQELGIADANMEVEFKAFRDNLKDDVAKGSRFSDKKNHPAILSEILTDPEDAVTTFQDLKAIRERITDDLIDNMGSQNPSRVKNRTLIGLQKELDELIKTLDELGPNYKQFRKEYFDEYIAPFEQGAVFKIKDKTGTGFYRKRDEEIADLFLDNESSAMQYMDQFGDDPDMLLALDNAALDSLKSSAVKDGVLNEKSFANWKQKKSKVLERLPSLSKKIDSIDTANNSIMKRQSQLAERRLNIEKKSIVKQLTKFEGGKVPAEKILKDSLLSPAKMKDLVSFIKKDPTALNGLKKLVWEKITEGNSQDVLTSLRNSESSLKQLFTTEHLGNLRDISKAKRMNEIVPKPKGVATSPRPGEKVEEFLGQGLPQISSKWYAGRSGRVSKKYLLMDGFLRVLRQGAETDLNKIYLEALYDSDVAKSMADAMGDLKVNPVKAKRLNSRLVTLGLPLMEEQYEQPVAP